MASLEFAGDNGSLSDISATQGEFRSQIAALTDMVKQIAGNAAVSAGNTAQADPLNAPFTLYVNPYTGSDEFVGGSYNDYETGATQAEIIESKLKRLEKQRLTCGFTPQRPFKTINRAVIEAAIITSKDWYTITDPAAHVDCVSIVLAPGVHTLYNDPGSSSTTLTSWGVSKDPTVSELIEFNPATVGGVLLPRGCSLCGPDLRKVTIRPNWVPSNADEAADYSNRREMLKITGTGYFFGFTVMDKIGLTDSHHLLSAFGFASQAELDDFYAKTFSAVGSGADLGSALTVTRGTEYQIVGPIDTTQVPTSAWDTTSSASPYIFNVSIRSDYGIGGAFMDGSKVEGLKSMVCANFTGVSLQKDMTCWERYTAGAWTTTTYAQYIAADPDDIRMKPERVSRHIAAINDSFIQEVSVFAIGQGIHHFTDKGGEITVTNSNSSFGGCAALSKGYKTFAFPSDLNWSVDSIRVPLNLSTKTGNISRTYLGTIASVTSSLITLNTALAVDSSSDDVPAILLDDGYTLASGTRIWVENPLGDDWRTSLTASAWTSTSPDQINVSGALQQSGTNNAPDINPDTGLSVAVGKRVYIRRLADTRTPEERRVSIKANNTAIARLPQRNFVVQTDPSRSGGAIASLFGTTGDDVILVGSAGSGDAAGAGVARTSNLTLRRGAANVSYSINTYYRRGSIVKYQGKHYQALNDLTTPATGGPDPALWGETFVHMPSAYNTEDNVTNEAPILVLDTDTSDDAFSSTLGIDFTNGWTTAGTLRDQYQTGTDYIGAYAFLVALGFSSAAAHAALVPQVEADRDRDPSSATDFPTAPSGGAASGLGNWAIEFRRPSVLRLYGHAWEWAGFLNYSKAVPAAQKDLGAQNKFTYYFTNDSGGRVVPQGSNEDGFNITPRGLEDIETGATVSVDAIDSATLDDIQGTDFPNGLTASSITVDSLTVTNTAFLPPTATTTEVAGPVELADAAELRDPTSIGGTTDAQRNSNISADPVVVTKKGLEYWKNENRLVSARSGTQYVYVDPVNGRNITSVDQLLADPPNSGISGKPIQSILAAANYANAAFGPTQVVEFRLAPGLYTEVETVTFKTVARIRAWDFTVQGYLNNSLTGGTEPFDASNFYDYTKQPTFITVPRQNILYKGTGQTAIIFYIYPSIRFVFEQEGTVMGVAWWGTQQTLHSTDVPDNLFLSTSDYVGADRINANNWRALAIGNFDNALNYYVRAQAVDVSTLEGTTGQVYAVRLREPAIEFRSEGFILNVAMGAWVPAERLFITAGSPIMVSSGEVQVAGLALMGNVRLDNSQNTGSYLGIRLRTASQLPGAYTVQTYELTGFSPVLFGCAKNANISLHFGNDNASSGTAGTPTLVYNNSYSNIRLFNSEATPAIASNVSSAASSSSYWKQLGPAFQGVLDQFGTYTSSPNSNTSWRQQSVAPNGSSGWEGVFGNYNTVGNSTANLKTTGLLASTLFSGRLKITNFGRGTETTIFRQAGSGALPPVDPPIDSSSNIIPGDIGAFTDWSPLNVRVRSIGQGIDVDDVRIVEQSVVI